MTRRVLGRLWGWITGADALGRARMAAADAAQEHTQARRRLARTVDYLARDIDDQLRGRPR
jgi:hypothetical protein